MRITRFVTSDDGGSRFQEYEIALDQSREDAFGHTIRFSAPYASPGVSVVELPAGLDQGWHNAPAEQLVIVLDGTIEVTTTDGETRRWSRDEMFMPADVDGRGHLTRAIDGPVTLVFAPLPGCD